MNNSKNKMDFCSYLVLVTYENTQYLLKGVCVVGVNVSIIVGGGALKAFPYNIICRGEVTEDPLPMPSDLCRNNLVSPAFLIFFMSLYNTFILIHFHIIFRFT